MTQTPEQKREYNRKRYHKLKNTKIKKYRESDAWIKSSRITNWKYYAPQVPTPVLKLPRRPRSGGSIRNELLPFLQPAGRTPCLEQPLPWQRSCSYSKNIKIITQINKSKRIFE